MVEMTRKQIIDSEYTIECPSCNYILIGNEPRYFLECNKCLNKNEDFDTNILEEIKNDNR